MEIPSHLKKFIVSQNYEKYSSEDQALWRYLIKQIKDVLYKHGHKSVLNGLEVSGITFEKIPKISEIDEKLQKFGWRAMFRSVVFFLLGLLWTFKFMASCPSPPSYEP